MARVKRRPDLETTENLCAIQYKCTCGKNIILQAEQIPVKLIRCWDCINISEKIRNKK